MEAPRSLVSLDDWDAKVYAGTVKEPPFAVGAPSTGIGCPNVLVGRPGVCGAHLWDLPRIAFLDWELAAFAHINGEVRRRVLCQVCGWDGTRAIAEIAAHVRRR